MVKEIKTVFKEGKSEIIVKKSRFISLAQRIDKEEQGLIIINKVKEIHRSAAHNVFAYQIGENNEIQRYSDDGEPQGTAGLPILDLLRREGLKNILVIVTRYFGGTLLGTGGLVRAYTQSAQEAIYDAKPCNMVLYHKYMIELNYQLMGKIQNSIIQKGFFIEDTNFTEKITFTVPIRWERIKEFEGLITDVTNGRVKPLCIDKGYFMEIDNKIVEGSWQKI